MHRRCCLLLIIVIPKTKDATKAWVSYVSHIPWMAPPHRPHEIMTQARYVGGWLSAGIPRSCEPIFAATTTTTKIGACTCTFQINRINGNIRRRTTVPHLGPSHIDGIHNLDKMRCPLLLLLPVYLYSRGLESCPAVGSQLLSCSTSMVIAKILGSYNSSPVYIHINPKAAQHASQHTPPSDEFPSWLSRGERKRRAMRPRKITRIFQNYHFCRVHPPFFST